VLFNRALTGYACAALAAGVAACGTAGSSSVTVAGKSLTIYASVPPGGAGGQQARDVLAAEQLSFQQGGGRVGSFTLRFARLTGKKVSDNARTAIEDSSAIAYLGELVPGSSADSLGITNAQDLLQVSPTDTALELTQTTSTVRNSPTRYYEQLKTYGRTFARVVPTTALEARAQVQTMRALGVKRLYVTDDGGNYGKSVALAVKTAAPSAITVLPSQTGADAVFVGASSESVAARAFGAAASADPKVKLFGPSALNDQSFVSQLSPAARNVYISAPGFLAKGLGPAGRKFVSDFKAAYHHAPATEAIFGYEAMQAVLSVLGQAGSSASNRATVVHGFINIRNRPSALGTYSINQNGDTSIAPFVVSRLKGGSLVPYRSAQG
jgi:branched-chain amino acid transport system substrate-binding protein